MSEGLTPNALAAVMAPNAPRSQVDEHPMLGQMPR